MPEMIVPESQTLPMINLVRNSRPQTPDQPSLFLSRMLWNLTGAHAGSSRQYFLKDLTSNMLEQTKQGGTRNSESENNVSRRLWPWRLSDVYVYMWMCTMYTRICTCIQMRPARLSQAFGPTEAGNDESGLTQT